MRLRTLKILTLLFGIMTALRVSAIAPITVSGVVRDSLTHEPISFASVLLLGSDRGTLTDESGRYSIYTTQPWDSVKVSAMGYGTRTVAAPENISKNIRIDFSIPSTGLRLGTLIAKPKKEHYTKKNNPAVAFMKRLREASEKNDPRNKPDYNYSKYERITLAVNDYRFNDSATGGLDRKFSFIKEYIDTSALSGVPILNVAVREKASTVHHRRQPETEREYVTGLRASGLDEILDPESMRKFYEDVMREIDVYSDDITILQNRFVSPLSRIAPDFYKFYLTDTTEIDSTECVELTFVPRNAASMGFTGRFYVPVADSAMVIKKIVMRVPHDINLNWVKGMLVTQQYDRLPDGTRIKMSDDMIIEATVIPGAPGVYARRNTVYTDHDFMPAPDRSIFDRDAEQIYAPAADMRGADFWDRHRTAGISHGERSMEAMMARLRSVPAYYWTEKIVKVFTSGYVPTWSPSYFDIGPMTSTFSTNKVEGFRLRAGGMTTAALSPRWFGRGYVAYGFGDHRWKYKAEIEYSFHDKRYHSREFPVHSIRATHMYDMDMLGQHYVTNNQDNMFMSWKRMEDIQMTYQRITKLEYILERENNFSLNLTLQNERQIPTRYMPFTDGYGRSFGHYTMNTAKLTLRYAPGEKFYQMKTGRLPINLDAPVFTLSHTWGPRWSAIGNPFALSSTEASFSKRWWFSAFGYVDVFLKGGHVWTRSPYPNLLIPNANLSYFIQLESFSCMNPMEFINDSYAQWDFTYWANGALLNNIPLLKRLKLREAILFRGMWGHLSHRNQPWLNHSLFTFPVQARTQVMTDRPYMEAGIGLDNVFRILRIDYTWRLTYRHDPGACLGGVRFMVHLTF